MIRARRKRKWRRRMSDAIATRIEPQFDDAEQQREAATMGMWLFIATEVLFFGGMFLGYTAYRVSYPQAFAEASRQTLIAFGSVNTAVLLISSAVMAFAVRAARANRRGLSCFLLLATASLGALFLVIKGFEYAREISEHLLPGGNFHIEAADPKHAELFFYIYWLMTGVHALHVAIGVVLITFFALRALFANAFRNHDTPVDLLGLYWHFVDIVWVFLFPLIYLVDRHS
jgi:cytochrome c oxidase subunit 3